MIQFLYGQKTLWSPSSCSAEHYKKRDAGWGSNSLSQLCVAIYQKLWTNEQSQVCCLWQADTSTKQGDLSPEDQGRLVPVGVSEVWGWNTATLKVKHRRAVPFGRDQTEGEGSDLAETRGTSGVTVACVWGLPKKGWLSTSWEGKTGWSHFLPSPPAWSTSWAKQCHQVENQALPPWALQSLLH